MSNIVLASISSHTISHLLLIYKIQHWSKNWLEQPWDNPMKCGNPDWAGMRADSHFPNHGFSLQNPSQLYDPHHDIIPPQPTDSQNPHSPPTRTQNDLQTPFKEPFFKHVGLTPGLAKGWLNYCRFKLTIVSQISKCLDWMNWFFFGCEWRHVRMVDTEVI